MAENAGACSGSADHLQHVSGHGVPDPVLGNAVCRQDRGVRGKYNGRQYRISDAEEAGQDMVNTQEPDKEAEDLRSV